MGRMGAFALLAISVASLAVSGCNPSGCARGREARLDGAVLIVLDTLRADGLSAYGNPRPTSPRIDALAQQRAEELARLEAELRTLRSSIAKEGPPSYAPQREVPPELRERLEALGYAQ